MRQIRPCLRETCWRNVGIVLVFVGAALFCWMLYVMAGG
jgi:hypothetical protein